MVHPGRLLLVYATFNKSIPSRWGRLLQESASLPGTRFNIRQEYMSLVKRYFDYVQSPKKQQRKSSPSSSCPVIARM